MSQTQGLELPFGIQTTNPVPVDSWAGPYSSIAEANNSVPQAVRYLGREVIIIEDGKAFKYVYQSGITNGDLVKDSAVTSIVTTHAILRSMQSENKLVTGVKYSIDTQTQHVIPYTNVVRLGDVETLVLTATSSNTFDPVVQSIQFPKDIIHYDINDVNIIANVDDSVLKDTFMGKPVLQDGYFDNYLTSDIHPIIPVDYTYQDGSPVLSSQRTGRIYKRIDPINRKSAPSDWRNVNLRRYHLKENTNGDKFIIVDESPFIELFDSGEPFTLASGYLYKYNSPVSGKMEYYSCKVGFTWNPPLTTITGLVQNGALLSITDFLNNLLTANYSPYYFSPRADSYVVRNYDFGNTKIYLEVDNTDYCDFSYFDNYPESKNVIADPDERLPTLSTCFNCHIEDYIAAYLEDVMKEYYPNIVFFGWANNVKIGKFTTDATLFKSSDIEIGEYNSNLYTKTFYGNLSKTVIGSHNVNTIFVAETFFGVSANAAGVNNIGSGNTDVCLYRCAISTVGDRNKGVFIFNSYGSKLGDLNTDVSLGSLQAPSIRAVVKDGTSLISMAHGTYYNEIQDNVASVFISLGSQKNLVKRGAMYISFADSSNLAIEGVFLNGLQGNIIGENCQNITVNGNRNRFENANLVTLKAPANGCTFRNMSNETFEDETVLTNAEFNYAN